MKPREALRSAVNAMEPREALGSAVNAMEPRATKIPVVARKNGPKTPLALDHLCKRFAWSFLSQKLFKDFLVTLVTREMKQLNL